MDEEDQGPLWRCDSPQYALWEVELLHDWKGKENGTHDTDQG
jgi:hypothetical protein